MANIFLLSLSERSAVVQVTIITAILQVWDPSRKQRITCHSGLNACLVQISWNGQQRQKFSRRILLTYHFSLPLPQVICSKPSFLPFSPRFVILPGGAGARGRGRGKTLDSVSLSWRNPLSDLCILSYNDKWICNFPPDWAATKNISTFARRQRAYSLPPSGSSNSYKHYKLL